MIIFLKLQSELINKRLNDINRSPNKDVVKTANARETFHSALSASKLFATYSKSISWYVRSFIPFTKPFAARVETAKRLSELRGKLDTIEILLKCPNIVDKRRIEPVKTEVPKMHKSPINFKQGNPNAKSFFKPAVPAYSTRGINPNACRIS